MTLIKFLRKSFVLDAKKKLFQINFYSNGEIKMCNFGSDHPISTFSNYNKLPMWIKENMDNSEVTNIVKELK